MTNKEFDVLDELYFVTSFKSIVKSLRWDSNDVLEQLGFLVEKGWVKCLDPLTEEEIECTNASLLGDIYDRVLFLATKKGLQEHNSK